jgi:hypothetical protein
MCLCWCGGEVPKIVLRTGRAESVRVVAERTLTSHQP